MRKMHNLLYFCFAVWWVYEWAEPRVKCPVNAKPRTGVDNKHVSKVLENLTSQQIILFELHTLSKQSNFPHIANMADSKWGSMALAGSWLPPEVYDILPHIMYLQ